MSKQSPTRQHSGPIRTWRVSFPGREAFTCVVVQKATLEEMRQHFPGALIEPGGEHARS